MKKPGGKGSEGPGGVQPARRDDRGGSPLLVLCLFIVLAIQLFLSAQVFLPAPHTGGDNAGYIALAHSLLERGAYLELWDPQEPVHTKYPPVFSLLLAGMMALGVKGWAGLKVVPFVSTLLAGLFAFLWVRGRGGMWMGLAVALALALSDAVLYYSRWILSDPTFLALTLGALWALEKGDDGGWAGGGSGAGSEDRDSAHGLGEGKGGRNGPAGGLLTGTPGAGTGLGWLMLGLGLVILAYFTRSAGLPLVAAALLYLALRRRWRVLAGFALAFLASAGLWWLRGRLRGGSEYVAEFWLLDPYRPELGRVGAGGLLLRLWENLVAYTTDLIPEGIMGGEGPLLPVVGLSLAVLALLGWIISLRERPRAAELFLPLYAGLMLLWPQVWSGDRFALPLIPLLLYFAARGLSALLSRFGPPVKFGGLGLAFLVLVIPAVGNWTGERDAARACREAASGEDPWACHPVNVREYVLMARWAGENLPDDAVVVTRKPRIFYVLSGVKTASLPLTSDAGVFLETARVKTAEYVTLDRWDSLAGYYLLDVLESRPEAFCFITGVEVGDEMGIRLLGIPGEGREETAGEGFLPRCPPGMLAPGTRSPATAEPGEIPLLAPGGSLPLGGPGAQSS